MVFLSFVALIQNWECHRIWEVGIFLQREDSGKLRHPSPRLRQVKEMGVIGELREPTSREVVVAFHHWEELRVVVLAVVLILGIAPVVLVVNFQEPG